MLAQLAYPFPHPWQRVRPGIEAGGRRMKYVRAAVLLVLWTLGACAQARPVSGPIPPPSQDDRGGMN
jgi:hypothetical protein